MSNWFEEVNKLSESVDASLSLEDFLDRAEVILVDDAKAFDINSWEKDITTELEEALGCKLAEATNTVFIKYQLTAEQVDKIIEKLKTSDINIADYWKTKQFLKKHNLHKEDLDAVIRSLEKDDYKYNPKDTNSSYNEAVIFIKNSKIKELGIFKLYIKLDYDSIEETPVIVISIHDAAEYFKTFCRAHRDTLE